MEDEQVKPADEGRRSSEELGGAVPKCTCGDRAADACPGQWEPGCDLGANAKHARRATPDVSAQVDAALGLKREPQPGSRWTGKGWPHGSVARVMGIVEGWVVWRRKGCMPQLRHVNQWHDGFVPAIPTKPKKTPNPELSGTAGARSNDR